MPKPATCAHLPPSFTHPIQRRGTEINILAITAYHGGWITETEELDIVRKYLDHTLVVERERPVIDVVIIRVRGATGVTHESLPPNIGGMKAYFRSGIEMLEKRIVVENLLKNPDIEDDSHIGFFQRPISLHQAIEMSEPKHIVSPW